MADFVALTTTETTAGKPQRQALWRKVKDDLDNHQARLLSIEGSVRLLDHFNWRPIEDSKSFENIRAVTTGQFGLGKNWLWQSDLADPSGSRNGAKPAFSVARMVIPATGGAFGYIQSLMNLRYDLSTPPIIYEARLKASADADVFCGVIDELKTTTGAQVTTNRRFVLLERVDATNWRFTRSNGTKTNGTNFTKPTAGNWFVVKIVLTNDPSDRALCYMDGVLKETFTTEVPTDRILHSIVQAGQVGSAIDFDVDRVEFSGAGAVDAT